MIASLAALAFAAAAPFTDAPPRMDDPGRTSKNGRLAADFDGGKVLVTYGRPSVKGRKVWGDLVPYGEVWRTGADEATVIAFEKNVKVEGKPLRAGYYALFTIPEQNGDWTIIFNGIPKQWGAYKYDASKDVLRVKTKAKPADAQEQLTFEKSGDAIVLRFEKLAVPFKITKD